LHDKELTLNVNSEKLKSKIYALQKLQSTYICKLDSEKYEYDFQEFLSNGA